MNEERLRRDMQLLADAIATAEGLDFSVDSLSRIDSLLRDPNRDSEFCRGAAAYVGEVLIRHEARFDWFWPPRRTASRGDEPAVRVSESSWTEPFQRVRWTRSGQQQGEGLIDYVRELLEWAQSADEQRALGWSSRLVSASNDELLRRDLQRLRAWWRDRRRGT